MRFLSSGRHSSDGNVALWYDNDVVYLHLFQHLEVDVVSGFGIGELKFRSNRSSIGVPSSRTNLLDIAVAC